MCVTSVYVCVGYFYCSSLLSQFYVLKDVLLSVTMFIHAFLRMRVAAHHWHQNQGMYFSIPIIILYVVYYAGIVTLLYSELDNNTLI